MRSIDFSTGVVATEILAASLDDIDLRLFDATYLLPSDDRDADVEFEKAHIRGAQRFDIRKIADRSTSLPNMLPTEDEFGRMVGALGVDNTHKIVVYDTSGTTTAARAWWMFRVFGHRDVAVLDGGLAKWRAEGRPMTDEITRPRTAHFNARLDPALIRDKQHIIDLVASKSATLIDARPSERFAGTASEPRSSLPAGHIPGARNVPSAGLLNADRTLLGSEALIQKFTDAGVDLHKPIVTTCGSGVTASILALALFRLGRTDVPVYDGSWAEWAADKTLPIETGAAIMS